MRERWDVRSSGQVVEMIALRGIVNRRRDGSTIILSHQLRNDLLHGNHVKKKT